MVTYMKIPSVAVASARVTLQHSSLREQLLAREPLPSIDVAYQAVPRRALTGRVFSAIGYPEWWGDRQRGGRGYGRGGRTGGRAGGRTCWCRFVNSRGGRGQDNIRAHNLNISAATSSHPATGSSGDASGLTGVTASQVQQVLEYLNSRKISSQLQVLNLYRKEIAMNSRDNFLLNILQSMGQAIIIFDATGTVTYWNRSAENLYGYSASEALGQDVLDLVVVREAREDAMHIFRKNASAENWTGTFQVKNKQGEPIFVHITITPLYDDNGTIVGIICVSVDARDFLQTPPVSSSKVNSNSSHLTSKPDHNDDSQQPLQVVVSSCGACKLTGDGDVPFKAPPVEKLSGRKFGGYGEKGETKTEIHKNNNSTEVASISKKNISSWPRIESQHDGLARTRHHQSFACMRDEQENDFVRPKTSLSSCGKPKVQVLGSNNQFENEANFCSNETHSSDYDIMNVFGFLICRFADLINELLIDALRFTVHVELYIVDVALKVFFKFECSDDLLQSFRQEVFLMKKLRHPNLLLFMGAVTSPHLCIVTQFLPRGSLFQLLHHSTCKIDWRRRVLMALDIARGMSYLHHCNPPIVHCDLKSSNLLVDKNWTVKVGDFGLSRIKHATYLSMMSGNGTPQWMAPEIIRNDPTDEKSDVYSFGVVLWELATSKIPWDTLDSFQVIGVVGFMDQRLEIPKDTDPNWTSLIESCWQSEPKCRPTSNELQEKLKAMQKRWSVRKPTSKTRLARVNDAVPQC
ncbi:LEAF RUST 10 DISEASE-RESISTANCE LOCUS RECEPTOR-LIKE PROTEIN KINASE-like 1.4 [Papaver somniferum]|uniref:LEAF RUST 10 DISEASE-RESISTANCE LOCUS RECEPTOR-LIKE PROTEIN KINASE-like 1.4 n=1 Tax=Papaver somniferum TaxID=3469 RepID=UPI000E6FB997|nr:LEAF RUST 10 DISEASE-RESISTANCE LOCUS RECEPTOR-LIKE PROTEIN KINASE-like 1.4 [Papaver somniferum]